jgi:flavin reductase (DIM6/NTAB) family NADH-FMN oxidoreductase RutF
MQISYDPMLVAVFVHDSPTLWNIKETRVFGVNISSDGQSGLVNIAGGYSGTEIQKLEIPDVFKTYRAKRIDVPMIAGCVLDAECKVRSISKVGDHVMVVGEVLSARFDESRKPLIYTRGNYWKLAGKIPSGRKTIRVTESQMAEFKRMSAGQFVLKAAAAIVRKDGKMLFVRLGRSWTVPLVAVDRGKDYKSAIRAHLESIGIDAGVVKMQGIERVMLKDGRSSLRANIIVFECKLKSVRGSFTGNWLGAPPRNTVMKNLVRFA